MTNKGVVLSFIPSLLLLPVMIGGVFIVNSFSEAKDHEYNEICTQIAIEIESCKEEFPQLTEFEAAKNLNIGTCIIEYEYNCHFPPKHQVGWRSGVPQPNDDGIWFYISLWDENDPDTGASQINTQPAMPLWYIGSRRVTYLMLSGKKAVPLYDKILDILKKYGLREL